MPIAPLDIRKKTFSKVRFGGVDSNEVKNFLEQLARDMEAIWKERTLLAEKVEELNAKLEGFTRTEKAFQEAFVAAQKTCDEMRNNARQEADTIIERAKLDGEKVLREAEEKTAKLADQIGEVRTRKLGLLAELRSTIESFSKMIEHLEEQETRKS